MYIGEHLIPGIIGTILIYVAFVSVVLSFIFFLINSFKKEKNILYNKIAYISYLIHFISFIFSFGIFVFIIINNYFEYKYVWQYTSRNLDTVYLISSIWGGQQGSCMLWILFQSILGIIIIKKYKNKDLAFSIVSLSQFFLILMILGLNLFNFKFGVNPFELLRNSSENIGNAFFTNPYYLKLIEDGSGLNPLLQNFWMAFHPPFLFFGYSLTLIPYALIINDLFKKNTNKENIKPWILLSIIFLGTGIFMGGIWAYKSLTFGGFWSWDPVENASLIPLIILIVSYHFLLIHRKSNTCIYFLYFTICFSYVFVLYSSLITRSGLLSSLSVHSFNDKNYLIILLLFFLLFAIIPFIYYKIYNYYHKPITIKKINISDINLFIGLIIMLLSAFQIFYLTTFPLIAKIFIPEIIIKNQIDLYNLWQSIFVFFAFLFMIITTNYNINLSKKYIKYNILISFIPSTIIIILIYIYWKNNINYLYLILISLFFIINILDLNLRKIVFKQNYRALISHLGLAIFILGLVFAFSGKREINNASNYDVKGNSSGVKLYRNEIASFNDYYINYKQINNYGNKKIYQLDFLRKEKDERYYYKYTLNPFIINSNKGNVFEPATKHFINKDLYIYIEYANITDTSMILEKSDIKELTIFDTIKFEDNLISLKKIEVDTNKKFDFNNIRITANLDVCNKSTYTIKPVYVVKNGNILHENIFLKELNLWFGFYEVSEKEKTIKIAINKVKPDFVVVRIVEYPFIILVWIGGVLILLGFTLSLIKKADL